MNGDIRVVDLVSLTLWPIMVIETLLTSWLGPWTWLRMNWGGAAEAGRWYEQTIYLQVLFFWKNMMDRTILKKQLRGLNNYILQRDQWNHKMGTVLGNTQFGLCIVEWVCIFVEFMMIDSCRVYWYAWLVQLGAFIERTMLSGMLWCVIPCT